MWRVYRFFSYIRRDIPRGIRNLIRWFPIIWQDYDWDWCSLAILMKFKAEHMVKIFECNNWVGADRSEKQLKILIYELDFLIKDDESRCFTDDPDANFGYKVDMDCVKKHGERRKDAQERVGMLISKHMMSWWD